MLVWFFVLLRPVCDSVDGFELVVIVHKRLSRILESKLIPDKGATLFELRAPRQQPCDSESHYANIAVGNKDVQCSGC